MAKYLGYEMDIRVWTDSDAGRSVASRRGLGKLRHMELRYLWVQDAVKDGRLEVKRVNGEANIADHLTKPKNWMEMQAMIKEAGGDLKWNAGSSSSGSEPWGRCVLD